MVRQPPTHINNPCLPPFVSPLFSSSRLTCKSAGMSADEASLQHSWPGYHTGSSPLCPGLLWYRPGEARWFECHEDSSLLPLVLSMAGSHSKCSSSPLVFLSSYCRFRSDQCCISSSLGFDVSSWRRAILWCPPAEVVVVAKNTGNGLSSTMASFLRLGVTTDGIGLRHQHLEECSTCQAPCVPSCTVCVFLYSSSSCFCISKSACLSRLSRCCSISRTTPACMACDGQLSSEALEISTYSLLTGLSPMDKGYNASSA